MTRLILDDALLGSLIKEVAPHVSAITGWDLGLAAMRSRLLPRERGYEEIVEDRLRLLGFSVNPERDLVDRSVEYLVEHNVLASYEPLSSTLLVVNENVDDSNLDGLKLVLGHELVHRGQHLHHPAAFDRINSILLQVIKGMETGQIDFQSVLGYYEQIKPLMTLVESHAAFVQGILHREVYPNARMEQRFSLPVILFRILGAGKISQYTAGLSRVAAAMQNGSLDRLFNRTGG